MTKEMYAQLFPKEQSTFLNMNESIHEKLRWKDVTVETPLVSPHGTHPELQRSASYQIERNELTVPASTCNMLTNRSSSVHATEEWRRLTK
ncbi:hypothetical protein VPH35_007823 [Triticum aestivum]